VIVTRSNQIEIDNQRKVVIFTGNVEAEREDFTITCNKMVLYYLDLPSVPAANTAQNPSMKIEKIVATGQVKVSRSEGGVATAEEAIYYQEDEKVILSGSPVIKQGDDFVEGSKVTLFLKENRSVVEGAGNTRVRAVLSPKN
jgi:lipopolysaccharide export system protein LptA